MYLNDTQTRKWEKLIDVLKRYRSCFVACSGGIDSLLLASICNYLLKENCIIFHAISPAVPETDTNRVREYADRYKWNLLVEKTGEFDNENYLSNPVNRCYYCKSHLYEKLVSIRNNIINYKLTDAPIFSGTNLNDLGEFRPGLIAAKEYGIEHPYVESKIGKNLIRTFANVLGLEYSDLPASPCLASRIYTGTRVTEERLQAIYFAETEFKKISKLKIVRCRLLEDKMLIEIQLQDRSSVNEMDIQQLREAVQQKYPIISEVKLDQNEYKPGRAFTVNSNNLTKANS
jgi:pyridinium-3,5-biscarboxylic acid mononucleotide sulfurtransferase